MPQLFDPLLSAFGGPVYSGKSRTRRVIDAKLLHACAAWRQKYPWPCTPRRSRLCLSLLSHAVLQACQATDQPSRYALLNWQLNTLVNDEATHAAFLATAPKQAPAGLAESLTHSLDDI